MRLSLRPRRLARHLTYANVAATLALFIAVGGGSAYAASRLITGSQIAKHTISAANIKNKSLTSAVFSKSALKAGPQGPAGPAGATGATGATGAQGATGAAGSAIAYGLIVTNSAGNPVFAAGGTSGFTTVYSPSTGVLCIPYPAGVTTNLPLAITDASNETGRWEQVNNGPCGGSGFDISNLSGGALAGDLSISIP